MLEHDGFGKNNIVRVDLEASYGESPERPVTVRLDKKLDNGDYGTALLFTNNKALLSGFCKKFARKIVIEDDDDKAEPKKLSDASKDEGSRVFHVVSASFFSPGAQCSSYSFGTRPILAVSSFLFAEYSMPTKNPL